MLSALSYLRVLRWTVFTEIMKVTDFLSFYPTPISEIRMPQKQMSDLMKAQR